MSVAAPDPTPLGTLEGLLAPQQSISLELAEYLLQFRFRPGDIDRMNELSRKAQLNSLTDEEDRELDEYIFVGDMLAVLHSKARRRLAEGKRANNA